MLQTMSASPFSCCSTCHSQPQWEGTCTVLPWVSSGSCNLHAQAEEAAFQLDNELQSAYHGVKGKHAVNRELPARNRGPRGLRAPFFPGKVRSV